MVFEHSLNREGLTMEPNPQRVTQNRLLGALPEKDLGALEASLERVRMRRGDIVYHPNAPVTDLYFPENCIISSLTVFDDGATIESGLIGNEGMAGVGLILSNSTAARETAVQVTGNGLRLKADKFKAVFESSEVLQRIVFNYAAAFFDQVAQVGACNNHHPVRERLARLLLMFHERTRGHRVKITQDCIAQMLCVHRPSVTLAASSLKEAGLIDYVRGAITIVDKHGLEESACECYGTISEGYRQYLIWLDRSSRNHSPATRGLPDRFTRYANFSADVDTAVADSADPIQAFEGLAEGYELCSRCHENVSDSRGAWRHISHFAGTRFSITLKDERCPSCSNSAAADA